MTPRSSRTMQFSTEPPRARPAARSFSTSCMKPNVRAGAIFFEEAVVMEVELQRLLADRRMREIDLVLERPAGSTGVMRMLLSPSTTSIGSLMRRTRISAPSARTPAASMRCMNGSALPSMIGTSGPSMWMSRSVMPQAMSAERRCSTVPTETSSRADGRGVIERGGGSLQRRNAQTAEVGADEGDAAARVVPGAARLWCRCRSGGRCR